MRRTPIAASILGLVIVGPACERTPRDAAVRSVGAAEPALVPVAAEPTPEGDPAVEVSVAPPVATTGDPSEPAPPEDIPPEPPVEPEPVPPPEPAIVVPPEYRATDPISEVGGEANNAISEMQGERGNDLSELDNPDRGNRIGEIDLPKPQ